jgi:hypothetical protein
MAVPVMVDAARPSTEVYRQSIEKLPRAMRRAQRTAAVRVVVGTALLVALTSLIPTASAETAIDRALVLALLGLLSSPYFMWRAGRLVRRYWNAFELSIGAESMRVSAKGAGRVSIRRDAVRSITEDTDGLDVTSVEGDVAQVPTTVEGYVDARARLAAWHGISWRINDVRWCAALVGFAALLGGIAFVFPRAEALAASLVAIHLAMSVSVAIEIHGDPRLSAPRKLLSSVFALGTTAALVAAVVLEAIR